MGMSQIASSPTAAVLIIGNEILSGRTQDINLNYIAKKLTAVGIRLAETRVVPDIENEIVDALNALRKKYTYVFTTGGIGPTHDDITADSIGKAFGLPVTENSEARKRLEAYYTADNLTPARLRMARMPETSQLIDNPSSSAPGFQVDNVYVMAGVPNIMQAMLDSVVPKLRHGPAIQSVSVSGYVPESLVAVELGEIAARYPQLDIGSYPWVKDARYGTALVTRGIDIAMVKAAADEIYAMVAKHDSKPVVE
jgi:molybdenum cofactor synthesis domain-containing protein